ncbi:MAG: SgcJ/EcaC family oxidoreductase [Actinobacteria bacterium]|nr:SgcJ/EcaC family oxidoreductase [Actinomycetota bacterium]
MTSNHATSIPARDDKDIRELFDKVSRAWAGGDVHGFTGRYAEEATVTFPGVHLPGRDAIRAAMATAFAGPVNGSRRIHDLQVIRFPSDRTAVVITNSATVFAGEPEAAADRWERVTWLLSAHDGRWLIDAYHSSPQNAA